MDYLFNIRSALVGIKIMSSQTVATVIVWQLPASLVWPVGQLIELDTKLDAATSSPEYCFGGLHTCRH